MPFRSSAQRKFLFANHPDVAKRWSVEFPNQGKLPAHVKKKKKPSISVKNNLKEYGNEENGKIQINVKKHKGNKAELADTIKHELNHAKHPRASEKAIQIKTKVDMSKMSYTEKEALTKKLRHKSLNYKKGAIKRKMKITRQDKVEPGDLIKKANLSKRNLAIRGMV